MLMQRYEREMIGLAYRMLGHREDALELAQEVFFRAWRGLPAFREEATFRTWIYQIALNLARHKRRWHVRHRTSQMVSLDAPVGEEEETPLIEQISDPAPDARRQVEQGELGWKISEAVARLPSELKTVVLLRDMNGLPYEEIAGICRQPVGTVKSRLHHGRVMLRELLRGIS